MKGVLFFLAIGVILCSCSSSKETAFMQRKYTNFKHGNTYVSLSKPKTNEKRLVYTPAGQNESAQQESLPFHATTKNVETPSIPFQSTATDALSKKRSTLSKFIKNEFIASTRKLDADEKVIRVTHQSEYSNIYNKEHNGFDTKFDPILLVIIAILIPPLAVYLKELHTRKHFWISVVLTLLFYLPGIIYSILVVTDTIR